MFKYLVVGLMTVSWGYAIDTAPAIVEQDNETFQGQISAFDKDPFKSIFISNFSGPVTITSRSYPGLPDSLVAEYRQPEKSVALHISPDNDNAITIRIKSEEEVPLKIYTAGKVFESLTARIYRKNSLTLSGFVAQRVLGIADKGDIFVSCLTQGKVDLSTHGTIRIEGIYRFNGSIQAETDSGAVKVNGIDYGTVYTKASPNPSRLTLSTPKGIISLRR